MKFNKFLVLILFGTCLAATMSAEIIYGDDSAGALVAITVTGSDFAFGTATAITGVTGTITDIAELNGVLYVTSDTALYVLNASDHATEIGTGYGAGITSVVALTFGPNGVLYAAESGSSTDYYTINLTTGVATAVPVTGATGGINSAGDLQVIGNTLYVTTGGTSGVSSLGAINLTTNVFTNLGTIETSGGATTFDEVFGLTVANGNLYGFDAANGDILNFGSTSGTITNVVTVVPSGDISGTVVDLYGATDDEITTPEPTTFGVIGIGLLGLVGLGYRRRKA